MGRMTQMMDKHDDYFAYRSTTDGDEPDGCGLGGFKTLILIVAAVELLWRLFS